MAFARVTTKGQVTISADIQKALNIEESDQLLFEVVQGHEARIRVVKRRRLLELYGALPTTRPFLGSEAGPPWPGVHAPGPNTPSHA
jgi:AbrB family looped-hinge helix DNA binding protein